MFCVCLYVLCCYSFKKRDLLLCCVGSELDSCFARDIHGRGVLEWKSIYYLHELGSGVKETLIHPGDT
jgi:hypothetical protein